MSIPCTTLSCPKNRDVTEEKMTIAAMRPAIEFSYRKQATESIVRAHKMKNANVYGRKENSSPLGCQKVATN